jgi:NAD-dependent deacetylase
MDDIESQAEQIADLIVKAKKIVVFTGAGISTESGIPDFRGKDGVWTKMDPDDFTIQKFIASEDIRAMHWKMLDGGGFGKDARPNEAHYAIAELEKIGKLDSVVTQNIDNLHAMAGNSPEIIFELHGNIQFARCLSCGKRYPMFEVLPRVKAEPVPACPDCHGILKPDAVFFGEALPEDVMEESALRASKCDLCIVIGSTLLVYPAANVPAYASYAGADIVIINIGATSMDQYAKVRVEGKAGDTMTRVMKHVKRKMSMKSV